MRDVDIEVTLGAKVWYQESAKAERIPGKVVAVHSDKLIDFESADGSFQVEECPLVQVTDNWPDSGAFSTFDIRTVFYAYVELGLISREKARNVELIDELVRLRQAVTGEDAALARRNIVNSKEPMSFTEMREYYLAEIGRRTTGA